MVNHDLRTLVAIVETYKQEQRRIRGLRETALQSYERFIRPFLRTTLGEDPLDLTQLMPPDVVQFVTKRSTATSWKGSDYAQLEPRCRR